MCVAVDPWRSPFPDKGKPAERRGRKATGQTASLTAGLPKKGLKLTGTKGSAGNGDLLWSRLSVRVQALSSFPSATTRTFLSFSRTCASAESPAGDRSQGESLTKRWSPSSFSRAIEVRAGHCAALSERLGNWVTAPCKEDYQMILPSLLVPRRAARVVPWVLAVVFTLVVGQAWAVAPEPPRVFLDTTLVAPTGTTIGVSSGGDLQAALNAAQPGDVITLQAGATFTGPFTLPNKAGTGWITVRTSAPDSSLPAPGTRVNPSYAAVMPKIVAGSNVGPAIQAASGAHHFRFIGIEAKPLPGAKTFRIIELGTGGETSTATLPHDIIIDRCYIHGNPGEPEIRGVAFNGSRLAVIDSYLSEFKDCCQDTQAIMGWNGPGPFKIVNNYLEAAGEHVMFGGADPSIVNLVPADIEIRHNYFFKPTSWRGVWAAVKNLFELKNARRVLIEGNIFENNWLAAQAGWAVQFTVRNQDGTAPWSTIEDVTFQKNIVRHSGSGLNILAADDPNPSQTMKRVIVRDTAFADITRTTAR